MNKKAQDWLNFSEILIALTCVFISLVLLQYAAEYEDVTVIHNLQEIRAEYKATQYFRTLLQTPVQVQFNDATTKTMTFAQAANKYFLHAQNKDSESLARPYFEALNKAILLSNHQTSSSFWTKAKIAFSTYIPGGTPILVPDVPTKTLELRLRHGADTPIQIEPIATIEEWFLSYLPEDFSILAPTYFGDVNTLPGHYVIEVGIS